MNFLYPKLTTIAVTFLLTACGGGGGIGGGNVTVKAVADPTLDVAKFSVVDMDGSSSSSDGGALSYSWEQTYGPDVTGGVALSGATPSFTSPDQVSTLLFTLTVDDGAGNMAMTNVQVNVLEHTGASFYVDGDAAPGGDGSRANPFNLIIDALAAIGLGTLVNHDVYVMTRANNERYDETPDELFVPAGTSLYGGYDASWVRDVTNNRTGVDGYIHAVTFEDVSIDAWFSGFDLVSLDGLVAGNTPTGVEVATGIATIYIEDNNITTGNVGAGTSATPGSSYGVRIAQVVQAQILRNTIIAGNGGNGTNGTRPSKARNGGSGGNASGQTRGSGGSRGSVSPESENIGGCGGPGGAIAGGNGGTVCVGSGNAFVHGTLIDLHGAAGSSATSGGDPNGGGGSFGWGGPGGDGGDGAMGDGSVSASGLFVSAVGATGQRGFASGGAGGGGGGNGGFVVTAGGGGGGGGGGRGGAGGTPGIGGGASIGIAISEVTNAIIENNNITSATGGNGGDGGAGGEGGNGGRGGNGADGNTGVGADGGGGGGGGGGGKAGEGGQGGGGGGGPSYAIIVGPNVVLSITDNEITSGTGGQAGSVGVGGFLGGQGSNGTKSGTDGNGGSGGNGRTAYSGVRGSHQFDGRNGQLAQGGWSYGIFDSDSADGAPTVSGNNFAVGAPGTNGQSGEQF